MKIKNFYIFNNIIDKKKYNSKVINYFKSHEDLN